MQRPLPTDATDANIDRGADQATLQARQSALILALLFGTLVLQNFVWPVVLRMNEARWPDAPAVIAMGLAFAQVGLAALVITLPAGRIAVRAAVTLVLYLGGAALAARSVEKDVRPWLANMLLCIAVMSAPLVVCRLAGVAVLPARKFSAVRGSRQFTIFGLLVLTTLVAVLLGIGRVIEIPWRQLGEAALFSVAIAVIPCVLGPLTLSRSPWPASIVAGATICPAIGALFTVTGFAPPNQPLELAAMASVQGAVIVAACLVARLADFRLTGPWER